MQELTTPSMNTAIDHDTLTFFCFPVYGAGYPSPMYDRMKIISGDKTPCVPVAVFGNRAVDDALLEMSELAEKCGFVTVAGCEMVAPHSIDPQFGAGRPDASDKAKLHDFLEKLKAAESFSPPNARRPNYASKKTPSCRCTPWPPRSAIGCGICEKYCPAGRDKGKHMRTVPTKVHSCMRCVSMCSTESRKVPAPMRLAAHLTLKKLCSERKEPKFYL